MTAIICIARENYGPLKILLEQTFDDAERPDHAPAPLVEYHYIHYTRALGGYSTTVNEHVREFIRLQDWLVELAPMIEGKTDDYQLQANFLLSMMYEHAGDSLWPDYAHSTRSAYRRSSGN